MYVCVSFDHACRLLGNGIVLSLDDYGCLVGCPIWICVGKFVYNLTIQPIDNVAYEPSKLVELIM